MKINTEDYFGDQEYSVLAAYKRTDEFKRAMFLGNKALRCLDEKGQEFDETEVRCAFIGACECNPELPHGVLLAGRPFGEDETSNAEIRAFLIGYVMVTVARLADSNSRLEALKAVGVKILELKYPDDFEIDGNSDEERELTE